MDPISSENPFPKGCNRCTKADATKKGARRISDNSIEKVLEQIGCRTALDHDEFSDVDTDDNNSVASREMYSEEDESDLK